MGKFVIGTPVSYPDKEGYGVVTELDGRFIAKWPDGSWFYLDDIPAPGTPLSSEPTGPQSRAIGSGLFDTTTTNLVSKTGASKGMKECRYDMIPWEPLAELALVYGKGEIKYPSGPTGPNWLNGMPYSWSIRAAKSHLEHFVAGVDFDDDDSVHHLAHAVWHLFALMTFQARGLGTDDRQHRGSTGL